MDSQQTQILKVVAGMFNAAPGKELLGVMNDYVAANDVQSLAVALAATPLFKSAVVGGDDAADVAALMSNFGFVADSDPASAGSLAQKYISDRVAAADDFGVIAYNIVTFLSSGSAPAIFAEAATLLSNKAAVSAAYSASLPSSDLSTLQSVLASVDGSHALTDAEIAAIIAPFSAPDTFVLTNGTDRKSVV